MLLYQTLKNKFTGVYATVRRKTYGEYVVRLFTLDAFGRAKSLPESCTYYGDSLDDACHTANQIVDTTCIA